MRIRDWVNLGIISIAAVAMGATFPDIRGALFALWSLIVVAYLLVLLGDKIGPLVLKSRFDRVLTPGPTVLSRPDDLQRCEHSFGWRSYSPRDFDHEIRPQLAAIILHKSKNRRVDVELMDVATSSFEDTRNEQSIRTGEIAQIVDQIERL
jgi:hypothetical protein